MNFYNQVIDKKGLKRILSWFLENYGPTRTSELIEYFKFLGFHYATQAGLSLGFDDLRIPSTKNLLLQAAQKQVKNCENNYLRGSITALERYQKLIDIWTTTSENLKEEVIQNFQRTPLNPLYMMAFSGARGNISQVRQLVGMRGLMSDSGGGIIDFPIRSNFREGLSVTEYVISCYGARKGLIDTALRTADSGYLTRRLVDVAHGILIGEIDCFTQFSLSVPLFEKNILGRVLAENLVDSNQEVSSGALNSHNPNLPLSSKEKLSENTKGDFAATRENNFSSPFHSKFQVPLRSARNSLMKSNYFAWKNQDISWSLSTEILARMSSTRSEIRVRSPLTCDGVGRKISLATPLGNSTAPFTLSLSVNPNITREITPQGGVISKSFLCYRPRKLPESWFPSLREGNKLPEEIGISSSWSRKNNQLFFGDLQRQGEKSYNEGQFPASNDSICQLCYGWNLSQGRLVSIGDAVGVLAAQSIGEPGTQLTMRTFHTGGIFSTDVQDKIFAPHEGFVSLRSRKLPKSWFPSLREGNQLPSANWKGSIEQLQEQSFLGCKVRSVHGETGFLSFEPIQISISVEKPEKFSVSLENEESGISRLPVLDVSPAKLLKQGIQESEPVRKKSSSVAQKKLSILQLPSQSLIFVYPGKFIQKNTLCAEISRVRAPLAMDSKKTNALAPHLLLQRNAAENKVEGQFEKPSASGEHVLNQSSEGFQRLVSPVVPEQNSETSVEIADNRVKNVLSEIQGQVALAPCGPNGVSQEVWVLAGEQYSLRALLSVPSALTSKVGFASKNSQEAQDTCKPTKSFQQQAFQVGDLFHWQGCRPSSPLSLFPVLKKQRVVAKRSGPATSSRLPQNINEAPSFELREGVILYAREQKTLISRSKDEALFTSISGLFPGAAFEKQNLALRSKSIGELIRNGDQIQYTTQIIRRQARLPHSRTIMEKTKKSSNRSMRLESSGKNDSILTKPFSYVLRRVQPHLFSGGVLAFDKDIREQSSPNHLSFQNQSKFSAPRHKPLNLRPIGSVVQEREILFQLSLPVEQSKTGDIVQGLPKIEQLFEGRGGSLFDEGVDQNSEKFQRSERSSGFGLQSGRVVLTSAVASDPAKKRFILQRRLVDEIQSVYQSQGVEIADKHVEIIVRQMTSKVKILEKGNTPFFPDDIVDFESLRRINPEHTSYEPIILGITKVAFFTESFISAASFQETKRVLMHSAIQTRVDFLTGLKENVIVGRLIPAGTGQMSV